MEYNITKIKQLLKGEIISHILFRTRPKYDKKYNFSICAIFKDEASFLQEWIEFNNMIGFDHFYLYNNNSTDDYISVLKPFLRSGLVTLIDFPEEHAQMKAYEHFYRSFRKETQWVSFLDIDEFMCPISHTSLKEWITQYEKYPVIQIYWKMFGTSGKMEHDYKKLVIEQYHTCWEKLFHCGKCLINTDYDIIRFFAGTHHCPEVWYPFMGKKIIVHPVNIFHRSTIGNGDFFCADESHPTIQINHYRSKAWDIYDAKRKKTDVFYEKNPKTEMWNFLWHEQQDCVVDYQIQRYIMALKLRMANIN